MLNINTFRVLLFPVFVFLFMPSLWAQKDAARLLEKARNSFDQGYYNSAVVIYNKLIQSDSGNVEYNYEIAQAYYLSDSLKLKSIPYFEFTLTHSRDSLPELYYFLGKAYQLDSRL